MSRNNIRLGDIANKLGLSEATVSLALNNKPGVNEKTREKVTEYAIEMGYIPNVLAQGLAGQKSGMIGIVIPNLDNYFYCNLAKKLEACVKLKGYNIMIATSENDIETERKVIERFISYHMEGILILPTNNDKCSLDVLLQHDIPCVSCGSFYTNLNISYVVSDLKKGSHELIKTLLSQGRERIALLGGQLKTPMIKKRLEGIELAYKKCGASFELFQFYPTIESTFEMAYEETKKLIAAGKQLEVIIAMNDYMALGVLKALTDMGIKVPEDMMIAEYDDAVMVEMASTPITSVAQDTDIMSQKITDILFQKIAGKSDELIQIEVDTHLILRRSTQIR